MHNCDENGICTNVQGYFSCKCDDQYVGNGTNCLGNTISYIFLTPYELLLACGCDEHAHCDDINGTPECNCHGGYRGDGYECRCIMFSVHCDIDIGFTVIVNETCKNERYPILPDSTEMFVSAIDYAASPEIYPDMSNISTSCKIGG